MKLSPENVEFIIIHSSHTKTPKPTDGVAFLNRLHRQAGAFSWDLAGPACRHHFVVRTDGTVEEGRPLDTPGNHTFGGVNDRSLSICYMGGCTDNGFPADTRTNEQKRALVDLVKHFAEAYPNARAICHCQITPKSARGCPGFTVEKL